MSISNRSIGLALAGLVAGCASHAESSSPDGVGSVESGLASEMTNGDAAIAYASRQYTVNPDIAVSQWANVSVVGSHWCNGVMIGPNVMFTASHCGADANATITFRTYRNLTTTTSDTETFSCSYLVQTYIDTDGLLYYCRPNASGQNPGDKYGYVDFDVSTTPSVGDAIYSISANPNQNGTIPVDARMYASGKITATNVVASATDGTFWFVPDANPNTGITTDLWCEGGMSGSPHFNPANGKMLLSPLSTGSGWTRNVISMKNLLYWGYANQSFDSTKQADPVNHAQISSLGLTPTDYYGYVDYNVDGEFDVQYDLERKAGEARRGWYWLGAESVRRNALWDPTSLATFDANGRTLRIHKALGTGYSDAVLHNKLNLAAGTYRIGLMTYTASASAPSSLWVSLKNGATYVGGEFVPNTVGSGWQMHTLSVTAPSDGLSLVLGARGTADVYVSGISIVRQGETMDFDTFDKRTNWRNDIDGSRAQVVPDGYATGTPNWAVRVSPQTSSGYPVRNRELVFTGGGTHRLCFTARREGSSGTAQGEIRVLSAGAQAMSYTFTPGAAWGSYCTSSFVPPSDDNNVQMRVVSGDAAYLVDAIQIVDF